MRFFFYSPVDKTDSETPKLKSDPNHAMQEHGLLNRKAQINININQHSVIRENEENTDIIHNLGKLHDIGRNVMTVRNLKF